MTKILHCKAHVALAFLAALVAPCWLTASALAQQVSSRCWALEQDLAAYDNQARGGQGNLRRIEQAYQKQYEAYQRAEGQAQQIGCRKQGFLFFQPTRPAECRGLDAQIGNMKANLETLAYQREQLLAGGNDANRNRILQALAENRCGAQYDQYATRTPSTGGSLFEGWFNSDDQPADPNYGAGQYYGVPNGGGAQTFRTVCVRQCDGAFFPINFAVGPEHFDADANQCVAMCPSAEVELYVYENPGSSMEQAVSLAGEPYVSHPNAFLYQKQYVRGCSCNQYTLKLHEREAERSALAPGATLPAPPQSTPQPAQPQPGQPQGQTQGSLTQPAETEADQTATDNGGDTATIIGLPQQELTNFTPIDQPLQPVGEPLIEQPAGQTWSGQAAPGVLTNSDVPQGAYVAGSAPNTSVETSNGVTIFRPGVPIVGQRFEPAPPAAEDPLVLDHSRGR